MLVHNLLDFSVEVLDLIFLCFNLLDEVVDLLEASIRLGVFDAFPQVVLVLLIESVPFLLLFCESGLEDITFQFGFVQILFKVGYLFLVVAGVVEGLNALANIDLAL